MKFKHSRLESFEDALDLIREGCYFGSVYLKDAYYSIPIHENYRRHLTLFWKEEYYHYIVLANEFSLAVRVFTKVLSPLSPLFVRKIYWWLTFTGRDHWDLFQEYLSYSSTLTGTKIYSSPRKVSLDSYTADNIPRVVQQL